MLFPRREPNAAETVSPFVRNQFPSQVGPTSGLTDKVIPSGWFSGFGAELLGLRKVRSCPSGFQKSNWMWGALTAYQKGGGGSS